MDSIQLIVNLIILALVAVQIAGLWKIFEKAGQEGWYAIIPIFNTYKTVKIAGRSGWWLLGFIIPIINIIVPFIIFIDLAKQFGKGTGYGILLALFPFIFMPHLGFGNATYQRNNQGLQYN